MTSFGVPLDVEGVTHRWVSAGAVRLHVAEAGAGDSVVLLLHGWPRHWWCWRHVLPALRGRHRVLMPDLRGAGWSDAPAGGYDIATAVGDVVALLDALGVERVKVAGHHRGGTVAAALAAAAPERVERVVTLGATARWPALVLALPLGARWAPSVARRVLALRGRGRVADDEAVEVYTERLSDRARARASARMARAALAAGARTAAADVERAPDADPEARPAEVVRRLVIAFG